MKRQTRRKAMRAPVTVRIETQLIWNDRQMSGRCKFRECPVCLSVVTMSFHPTLKLRFSCGRAKLLRSRRSYKFPTFWHINVSRLDASHLIGTIPRRVVGGAKLLNPSSRAERSPMSPQIFDIILRIG